MRRKDGRRVLFVRKADLAELKSVTRGAVTRACKGPLKPATSADGLVDRNHPAVLRWLGPSADKPSREDVLLFDETAVQIEEFAQTTGIPVAELQLAVDSELAPALVPKGHLALREFATRSGATVSEIVVATDGELEPALVRGGRLNIGHEAALKFCSKRPFARAKSGDPVVPRGYLACACVGNQIDATHPVFHAFLARCLGRVPTSKDLGL